MRLGWPITRALSATGFHSLQTARTHLMILIEQKDKKEILPNNKN